MGNEDILAMDELNRWDVAHATILGMFPATDAACRKIVPNYKALHPERLARLAIGLGIEVNWSRISEWSDLSTDETLALVWKRTYTHGKVIAIHQDSFLQTGPLVVPAVDFCDFARSYVSPFGRPLFDGLDVSLVLPDEQIIIIMHHDGGYATIQLAGVSVVKS